MQEMQNNQNGGVRMTNKGTQINVEFSSLIEICTNDCRAMVNQILTE